MPHVPIPRSVVIVVAFVIVGVWAFSQVAKVYYPGYEPPDGIHAALMLAAGLIFGVGRKRDDDDEPDTPPAVAPPSPPTPLPVPDPPSTPAASSSSSLSVAELLARNGRTAEIPPTSGRRHRDS